MYKCYLPSASGPLKGHRWYQLHQTAIYKFQTEPREQTERFNITTYLVGSETLSPQQLAGSMSGVLRPPPHSSPAQTVSGLPELSRGLLHLDENSQPLPKEGNEITTSAFTNKMFHGIFFHHCNKNLTQHAGKIIQNKSNIKPPFHAILILSSVFKKFSDKIFYCCVSLTHATLKGSYVKTYIIYTLVATDITLTLNINIYLLLHTVFV